MFVFDLCGPVVGGLLPPLTTPYRPHLCSVLCIFMLVLAVCYQKSCHIMLGFSTALLPVCLSLIVVSANIGPKPVQVSVMGDIGALISVQRDKRERMANVLHVRG